MDIDMLGRTDNDMEVLVAQLREVICTDLSDEDGNSGDGIPISGDFGSGGPPRRDVRGYLILSPISRRV
jgi:hypothetical protein